MSFNLTCPPQYQLNDDLCFHSNWPPTFSIVLGTIFLGFSNSLATLAGIGGGSMSMVILMTFFSYLPKDASLVVYSCVVGTSAGNTFNLFRKAYNGKPIIQYKLAFGSIPIIFTGSFAGLLMNKLFPSIITYSIIVTVFLSLVKKTYHRFINEYRKQNEQILKYGEKIGDLHQQSQAQPFKDEQTVYVLKNLTFLILIIILLSFVRGSSKFPSILGVQPCSATYWLLFIFSFLVILAYAYRNIQIMKSWQPKNDQIAVSYCQQQKIDLFETHRKQVIQKSIYAGIFSGFGLGGGNLLVSMYRNLGCKPLEASSTSSFTIFTTSLINCILAVTFGVIQVTEFFFFVIFLGFCSFSISKVISSQLRKRNRFSLVEGILLFLTILAMINIPISLYNRYVGSGYNPKVIFGFGTFC